MSYKIESELIELRQKMENIETLLIELLKCSDKELIEKHSIGDWLDQKTIMQLTGLGKTKLYELRKQNRISSSTICGKAKFYRFSDFEKLLDYNEKTR